MADRNESRGRADTRERAASAGLLNGDFASIVAAVFLGNVSAGLLVWLLVLVVLGADGITVR